MSLGEDSPLGTGPTPETQVYPAYNGSATSVSQFTHLSNGVSSLLPSSKSRKDARRGILKGTQQPGTSAVLSPHQGPPSLYQETSLQGFTEPLVPGQLWPRAGVNEDVSPSCALGKAPGKPNIGPSWPPGGPVVKTRTGVDGKVTGSTLSSTFRQWTWAPDAVPHFFLWPLKN